MSVLPGPSMPNGRVAYVCSPRRRPDVTEVAYECGLAEIGYETRIVSSTQGLPLQPDVPVWADVRATAALFRGTLPPLSCYPGPWRRHLHRDLWCGSAFPPPPLPVWSKSIQPKLASGRVYSDMDEYGMGLLHLEGRDLWFSEPVEFVSEWRCVVCEGKIVAVGHYKGDVAAVPDFAAVRSWLEQWPEQPAGFGVDVGIMDGKTALVEVNDGYALGYWGGDEAAYARAFVARWREMVTDQRVRPGEIEA